MDDAARKLQPRDTRRRPEDRLLLARTIRRHAPAMRELRRMRVSCAGSWSNIVYAEAAAAP